jgi:hypothetical protein
MKKLLILVMVCLVVTIASGCLMRDTHMFVFPQGYAGWVEVVYDQPGEPAIKRDRGRNLI